MFFVHEKTINDKKDSSFINLTWNNFSLFRYGSAETLEEIHKRGGWHERGDQRSRSQTESRVSRFFTGNRFDFGAILRLRRRVFVDVLERHSTIRLLHPFDSIFPIFRFRVKNVIKKKKKRTRVKKKKERKGGRNRIFLFQRRHDHRFFLSPPPVCFKHSVPRYYTAKQYDFGKDYVDEMYCVSSLHSFDHSIDDTLQDLADELESKWNYFGECLFGK